jgi:beta-carotene 3-hydroxylase
VTAILVTLAAFVAMEPFAALAHRVVMHRGRGWAWHASHHRARRRPDRPRPRAAHEFEANDWFPVVFSVATVAVLVLGTTIDGWQALVWIGSGVTAYGVAYLVVHDGYVHARAGELPGSGCRYVRWVRAAHARHHATGDGPFGFLAPITPRVAQRYVPGRSEPSGT